jgi:hypothetical protein
MYEQILLYEEISEKLSTQNGLLEPLHVSTSKICKLFEDCTSNFMNPLNQQELSLRTPVAFKKIGILWSIFIEAVYQYFF